MSWSARQSFVLEVNNSMLNGSRIFCFDLETIARKIRSIIKDKSKEVTVLVDPFLMADLYAELPIGESFSRILDPTFPKDKHAKTVFDESKLTSFLAFSHYLVITYSDAYIHGKLKVIMLDDRRDILAGLDSVFASRRARELIPNRLAIDMRIYDGSVLYVNQFNTIHGAGRVEKSFVNYLKTINKMFEEKSVDVKDGINAVKDLDLKKFIDVYLTDVSSLTKTQRMFKEKSPLISPVDKGDCSGCRLI